MSGRDAVATAVPAIRVDAANAAPLRPEGAYVLYWMVAARRTAYSYALQRALEQCAALGRPLVVLEALRAGYEHASDRLHGFALQGMEENARRLAGTPVRYYPYVEPEAGAGRGLLERLAARACVVVTDEFPDHFLPRMLAAAAARLDVRLERVDGNGLLPLRAAPKAFTHAHHFRRFLQHELPRHLGAAPAADPLAAAAALPRLPDDALAEVERRWPPATPAMLAADDAALRTLPIDHAVPPVAMRGGAAAAEERLAGFVDAGLGRYAEARNRLDEPAASGLSPYLHWGHLSPHAVLDALARRDGWSADAAAAGGEGPWTGMSDASAAFLEELVTWRELSFNTSFHLPHHTEYRSLPAWARATLERHAADPRAVRYPLEVLEAGRTADALWNAAQGQLLREGRIQNYMRMLWGKLVIGWTADAHEALELLARLNNRWALDGRDPNSWSGIFWCFGRYDRAWGPERPVYGTVRYMTSASTARKLRVRGYVERYTADV